LSSLGICLPCQVMPADLRVVHTSAPQVSAIDPLAWVVCAHTRRQFDDARARARRWIKRLGGELLVLDGAAPSGWGRWAPLG
jgi:hypothetical protein